MTIAELEARCRQAKVIPVLTVQGEADAVPLCRALAAGGLDVLEITLRSEGALRALAAVRAALPDAIVGAGTLLTASQVDEAVSAGAQFLVTPGATESIVAALAGCMAPALPGTSTIGEMMRLREAGFRHLKFFPAEPAGGAPFLRAVAGPLPDLVFCPTGGIDAAKARGYLGLRSVMCVGGSWVAPPDAVAKGDFAAVTALAQAARAMV
jgi:2-dehydro-3-deoxyphosphogluconate aldolase/(4S)-4-hydroxy-2-oxoglutarate aldolase